MTRRQLLALPLAAPLMKATAIPPPKDYTFRSMDIIIGDRMLRVCATNSGKIFHVEDVTDRYSWVTKANITEAQK